MTTMEQQLMEHGYLLAMKGLPIYRKSFGEISVEMSLCTPGCEEWVCHIDDDHAMTLGSLMVTSYIEVQAFIIFIKNILKIRQLKAKRK